MDPLLVLLAYVCGVLLCANVPASAAGGDSHQPTATTHRRPHPITHHPSLVAIMINAVLVFNNAGQPRLTKFYTQLV